MIPAWPFIFPQTSSGSPAPPDTAIAWDDTDGLIWDDTDETDWDS